MGDVTPMSREERRAARRKGGIKMVARTAAPAARQTVTPDAAPLCTVRPRGTVEQVQQDGTRVQMMVFHVYTPDGVLMVIPTTTGDQPVTLVSMPVPVGRALILTPGQAVR